jgi:hypothetical protein
MRVLAILGHTFLLVALLAGTATGGAIHCGGANCEKLRIRCSGSDPCYVGILSYGVEGIYVTVVRRHDGQDTTEVINLARLVDVSIRTGSGDDGVGLEQAQVEGDLRISTGGGNDSVGAEDGSLSGHTRIETGRGDDEIFFHGPGIYGPLLVTTGAGNDTVTIGFPATDDDKRLDGGTGNDLLYLSGVPLRPPTVERFESVNLN